MRDRHRQDPGAVSGAVAGAAFIAGLGAAMARSELPYPRPGATGEDIQRYFKQPSRAPWLSVAGQLVSAAALARFTTSVARLASGARTRPRTLEGVAVAGGAMATAGLATSGALSATLASARRHDPERAARLAKRAFAAGGPIHGVGFGLLMAALGVGGLQTRALTRPVAFTALASVAPNLLGPLYFIREPAGWFIPAGRFPGLIVTAIAGVRLSRTSTR